MMNSVPRTVSNQYTARVVPEFQSPKNQPNAGTALIARAVRKCGSFMARPVFSPQSGTKCTNFSRSVPRRPAGPLVFIKI